MPTNGKYNYCSLFPNNPYILLKHLTYYIREGTVFLHPTMEGQIVSTIIYRTDKKTGNVFAYESVSFRDPITKKPRNKRTYLGRVNPINGEIIPKAEKGHRNRGVTSNQVAEIQNTLAARVEELNSENNQLREQLSVAEGIISSSVNLINEIRTLIDNYEAAHGK